MYKKSVLFAALFLTLLAADAQTSVKRYVLLEHFTNSRCGICASRNPAFYSLINNYPADVHHLAVYPPVPYSNCVFYLANPTANQTRANFYTINGTPRVAVNGNLIAAGNPLLPPATLQAALNQTSPLHVEVTETGAGASRTATIVLSALDAIPAGNYRLFAMVAEKTINQTTPNGETSHHDVLRELLIDPAGTPVTLPAAGSTATFTTSYNIPAGWNADEIYVLAFVQNIDSKVVLNSGTRFDPPLTTGTQASKAATLRLYPSPATDMAFARLDNGAAAADVSVYDLSGRRVAVPVEIEGNVVALQTAHLAPGVYLVKIDDGKTVRVGKLAKQ